MHHAIKRKALYHTCLVKCEVNARSKSSNRALGRWVLPNIVLQGFYFGLYLTKCPTNKTSLAGFYGGVLPSSLSH